MMAVAPEYPKRCTNCELVESCRGHKYLDHPSPKRVDDEDGLVGFCTFYEVVAWAVQNLNSLLFLRWMHKRGGEGEPTERFDSWDDEFNRAKGKEW